MNRTKQPLVVTPPPHHIESLLGYVLRVSTNNGYDTPWYLMKYAGLSQDQIVTAGFPAEKFAAILGRNAAELEQISYCGISQDGKPEFRILGHSLGQSLQYNPLRLAKPSFCLQCAQEDGFLKAFWDLSFVVACPKHCCALVSKCPECGEALRWFRPGILKCKCGASLTNAPLHEVSQELVVLMAIIHEKVCGNPLSAIDNPCRFPIHELESVSLRSMLVALPALGRFNLSIRGMVKDFNPMSIANSAIEVLRDWPVGYHEFLRRVGIHNSSESAVSAIGLRKRFEKFYSSMFKHKRRIEGMDFLRDEFIRFGLEEWGESVVDTKLLRGQPRYKRFISKSELANQLGVRPITLRRWAEQGFMPMNRISAGSKKRYIVDSLAITVQKGSDGKTLGIREAAAYVGLPVSVLNALRDSGHYKVRHLARFRKAFHEKDLREFTDLVLSQGNVITEIPLGSISLGEVMLLKFRNNTGKADFMREVLSHRIEVIGRIGASLVGLLFCRESVEQFLRDKRAESENSTWSLREAAKYLHCDPITLPTLIQEGLIEMVESSAGNRVTEKSVKNFDAKFISLAKLAKSNGTSSCRLKTICTNQHIPLEVFNRGYGKVGQPFVEREYCDSISHIMCD